MECPDETEGAYVKPGTYKVTVRAKENSGYIGSKDCRPEIRWYRKNTGTAIRPTVDIDNLEEGKNYTVEYMDNVEVGKATVLVKGINDYTGTVKKTFKITPFDISKNTGDSFKVVSESITVAYAKGGSKPSVEVTFNGTDMVEGVDYEIVEDGYSKNINKGTAKLTVRGIGEYGGTKTASFKIKAQTMSWADWYKNTMSWLRGIFQ